jgi:hypothetical protein
MRLIPRFSISRVLYCPDDETPTYRAVRTLSFGWLWWWFRVPLWVVERRDSYWDGWWK